jgi:RHS repeat-associated protein
MTPEASRVVRWTRAVTGSTVAATATILVLALGSPGQELPDFELQEFDPGTTLNMLTDATANEAGPSAPLTGLATPIEVDKLFGTSKVAIPIQTPPGRNGLKLDLAVRYSSNTTNGLFGLGWGLQLGSIKRNTANGVPLASDGSAQYSDASGFVLTFPGGTVVLDTCQDTGTCNYWSASSEETWLQAYFDRANNQWQVTDNSGIVYTFGGQDQVLSRVGTCSAQARYTYSWGLTSVEDPNGNTIQVSYFPQTDVQGSTPECGGIVTNVTALPGQIDYGGNSAAGLPPIFHVLFHSQERPDIVARGYRNGLFSETLYRRVSTISVWVDGYTTVTSPTRQYQFTYQQDPDTGVSLLSSVSETLAAGTTPPPATTFTYQQSAHTLQSPGNLNFLNVPASPLSLAVSTSNPDRTSRGFVDVNGDGLPDLVDGWTGASGGANLYLNQGSQGFKYTAGWTALGDGQNPSRFDLSGSVFRMIDINGDGLPDAIQANTSSCLSPASGATTCSWNVYLNDNGTLQQTPSLWPGVPVDLGGQLPTAWHTGPPTSALIDFNGDGLPDILDCVGFTCTYYENTGAGFDKRFPIAVPHAWDALCIPESSCWSWRTVLSARDSLGDVIRDLIDINGDALPDFVSSEPLSGTGHWDVWFNTGNKFLGPFPWPAPPFSDYRQYLIEAKQNGLTTGALRDMNGDGLLDYVDATTSPWTVYLNTGAGFSSIGTPWPGTTGLSAISVWTQGTPHAETSDVLDINGDGIADYVQVSPDTGQFLQARLGQGSRPNLLIGEQNGLGASWSAAYVPSTDPNSAGSGCQGGSNDGAPCLTNAECPGGTCTAPCPDCSKLPFPVYVVNTLTEHSGFSGSGNDLTTQYTFTGGYLDANGRQFRGFRQSVEKRVGDGRIIRRQYAPPPFGTCNLPPFECFILSLVVPSRPFKLVDKQVLDGSGRLLTESSVTWGSATLPDGRAQVHPTKRVDTTYSTSGTTTKTRTRTFDDYDSYNNITSTTLSGDDVSATTTTIAYWPSCHSSPEQITVTGGGTTWSVKNFTYDSRCNTLTVGGLLAAAGQSANTGTSVTTTTVVYDSNIDSAAAASGQPTKIYDGNNNLTTVSYSCNQELYPCDITNAQQQVTRAVYDLQWGKPVSVTDANSNVTSYTYDGLGRLLSITKPLDVLNGIPYAWRMYAYQFGAPGTPPTPSRIDTFVREIYAPGGYVQSSTFYDSIGRALETKRQAVVGGASAVVTTGAVTFDAAGRTASTAAAFIAAQPIGTYEAAPSTAGFTQYIHDALDRTIQTTNSDGTYRTDDFSLAGRAFTRDENATAYDAGQRTNVSGAGRRRETLSDALGRLEETRDYDGATLNDASLRARTTHTYDPLGRVATITSYKTLEDTGTNTTTVTYGYDSFSRRTGLQDPDSGLWSYKYDKAGNLVYQNDPKTYQHLEFCYDNLNRLRCRFGFTAGDSWSGGSLCPSPASPTSACPSYPPNMILLADYRYDTYASPLNSSFTCGSGWGRVCRISDTSGWTSFSYDARGRVVSSEKTISAAGFTKTFTYGFSHDVADHLSWTTYPTDISTQSLSYWYDAVGQLRLALTGNGETLVSSMYYDRFGRLTTQTDGDSVTDSWTYFDGSSSGPANQFRLQESKVANGSNVYQKLDYGPYDKAGNLKTVSDDSAAYPTSYTYPQGTARDAGWTYQDDGLGRLKMMLPQATSTWGTSGSFNYDLIGNMSSRSGLTFTPDQTRPHHVSYSTPLPGSSSIYQYDPDGGLSLRGDTDGAGPDTGWSIVYDIEGHVQSVTVPGSPSKTVQSVYDYSGARVARIVTSGTSSVPTFYFGRQFEVTGNQLTRHFYMGNRRVAEDQITLSSSSPLILARVDKDDGGGIQVARTTLEDFLRRPLLYPRYILARTDAVKVFGVVLLLLIILDLTPGRVRLGFASRGGAMFRRVRRGHVIVVVLAFSLSLTPLVCVQPARAGGGGGGGSPPPPVVFPTYFVHTDHLGSTTLLTCYSRPSGENCPNGTPAAYFRYDAYGAMKAFDTAGNAVASGSEKTDLLYTGKRWGAAERLYYYGARFYDPQIAAFLTEEPLLGTRMNVAPRTSPANLLAIHPAFSNPYEYGVWNPLSYRDPNGQIPLVAVGVVGAGALLGGWASYEAGGSFWSGFVTGGVLTAGGFFGPIEAIAGSELGFIGLTTGSSAVGGTAGSIESIWESQGWSGLLSEESAGKVMTTTLWEGALGLNAGAFAWLGAAYWGLSPEAAGALATLLNGAFDVAGAPVTGELAAVGTAEGSGDLLSAGDVSGASWDVGGWDTGGWDSSGWDTSGWDTGGWDTGSWDTGGWDTGGWDTGGW